MSKLVRTPLDAEELREAFDASFARPALATEASSVPLLAIRVAGEPMALRVHEAAGLLQAGAIVPLPSRRAALLGISGIRGTVVPVYSLARLLHRGDDGEPRWLVLAAATTGERVGLAFATFERHVVAAARDLTSPGYGTGEAHVAELLHLDGAARPVLSIPSLVRAITGH